MTQFRKIERDVQEIVKEFSRTPEEIQIVAVSKGRSVEQIQKVFEEGCHLFGESRLQEALPKIEQAPKEVEWHLIGTLQKNKVRKALPFFQLIHSVDSFELAEKISQCATELGLTTHVLLQVNTSNEPSKHGLKGEEWKQLFDAVMALPSLSVDGLMTIGPNTEDQGAVLRSFASLRLLRDELRGTSKILPHLSMGMSHDYPLAIREGATLLRIGKALFAGY